MREMRAVIADVPTRLPITRRPITWQPITWQPITWQPITWQPITWQPWAGRAAALLLAGAVSLSGGGAAAQMLSPCDRPGSLGADAELRVTQQKGRALIEIAKANSAGRGVDVEYGDEIYRQKFGADGRVRMAFALTAPRNTFRLMLSEAAPIICSLAVPDFNQFYRVVLRWRDPVQLDLNVIEPGGKIGGPGHVKGTGKNKGLGQGIGQMDIVAGVPADGATAEISYVVDGPAIPPGDAFGFRLDYVTRGEQPVLPYCDDAPLATPRFEFIVIEHGTVKTRTMGLNRAHCNEKIPEAGRLMPIRR